MNRERDRDREEDLGPSLGARLLARLTDNLSLKIISVVVSLILFVILHSSSDQQRTIDVELYEKTPDDPNVVLLTPLPSRVRVTVKGPRALLDELTTNVDPVTVDLSKAPARVSLADLDYKLPTGVQRVQVVPTYIPLRWDTRITKRVPVEVTWTAPPEGLAIKNLIVDPSSIGVTGPKSIIDVMQRLRTNGINLAHREVGSHTQSLFIDLSENPAIAGTQLSTDAEVKLSVDTVEARFELVPETKTRTFANLSVIALGGKGVTMRPLKVTVVVTCPPRRTDELTADAIVPKIDLLSLGPDFAKKGPEEADVKVDAPGCTDVDVSPPRVVVTR